jgi:DNA polymerase alpha subunit A
MTEVVVERIHEYLGQIGENVRSGAIKLDEFIINKRLGKNPEDYPDAKSQPHVQVALRAKGRGGSAKAGDVISYVFCVPEGGDVKGGGAPKAAQADCAKSPDEVRKAGSELVVGQLISFLCLRH